MFPGEETERIQVDGNAYDCHLGVLKIRVCAYDPTQTPHVHYRLFWSSQ